MSDIHQVSGELRAIPIRGFPTLTGKDAHLTFIELLTKRIAQPDPPQILPGDILAISHTFLSKIYGFYRHPSEIKVSALARKLAPYCEKDPAFMQLILDQSRDLIRVGPVTITENNAGIIGANAGLDKSNSPDNLGWIYIPSHFEAILKEIDADLFKLMKFHIGLIVTDSVGRPFRMGSVGVAVATWGFDAWEDLRGRQDLYNYTLKHKELGIADSLASMADLVMGGANEGIPIAILRGWHSQAFKPNNPGTFNNIESLHRPRNKDLFRQRDWTAIPKELAKELQKLFPQDSK